VPVLGLSCGCSGVSEGGSRWGIKGCVLEDADAGIGRRWPPIVTKRGLGVGRTLRCGVSGWGGGGIGVHVGISGMSAGTVVVNNGVDSTVRSVGGDRGLDGGTVFAWVPACTGDGGGGEGRGGGRCGVGSEE